jgi:imidazolonepropionase-like amidohydrolase
MPGIIDPYFEVAIAAATANAGPRTITIGGRTISLPAGGGIQTGGFTRIADNFYPYESGYKSLPRVGLTRLNLVTTGAGQAAVVRVTPTEPDRMMDRPDGVAFLSVTNSSASLDQLRSRIDTSARRGGGRSGFGGGRPGGSTTAAGSQLWADVRAGKTPLIVACANGATIVHVMEIVQSHKALKLTLFASGVACAEAADSLKGRPVRVLLHPKIELLPNTRDRFAGARLLHDLGVPVAFTLTANPAAGGIFDPAGAAEAAVAADFPLFPVAMMVKAGLPRQAALEALSKQPAMMLGLGATLGTIEPGKAADLALFTGDPLDPGSQLKFTLIDGRMAHAHD